MNGDPYANDDEEADAYTDEPVSKSNKDKSSSDALTVVIVIVVALIGLVVVLIILRNFRRYKSSETYAEFTERRLSPVHIAADSGNEIGGNETELVPLEAERAALPELDDAVPKVKLNIRRKSQEPRIQQPPEEKSPEEGASSPLHSRRKKQHPSGLGAIFEDVEDSDDVPGFEDNDPKTLANGNSSMV